MLKVIWRNWILEAAEKQLTQAFGNWPWRRPRSSVVSRASGEHTLCITRWRLMSCEIWRSVVCDVWEEFTVVIFHPEDGGSKLPHSMENFLPDYTATYHKRRQFILTAVGTSKVAYYKKVWEKVWRILGNKSEKVADSWIKLHNIRRFIIRTQRQILIRGPKQGRWNWWQTGEDMQTELIRKSEGRKVSWRRKCKH
jgi:hypothetical protein